MTVLAARALVKDYQANGSPRRALDGVSLELQTGGDATGRVLEWLREIEE